MAKWKYLVTNEKRNNRKKWRFRNLSKCVLNWIDEMKSIYNNIQKYKIKIDTFVVVAVVILIDLESLRIADCWCWWNDASKFHTIANISSRNPFIFHFAKSILNKYNFIFPLETKASVKVKFNWKSIGSIGKLFNGKWFY